METTLTKTADNKILSTNANELNEGIKEVIKNIKKLVEKWNYQVTGDLDKLENKDFTIDILSIQSNNKKKKLRDLINRVNYRTTMRNANIFLNFLGNLSGTEKVKIDYSEEEKAIKKARKEWKEQRDKAELSLKFYKSSKGDFYKSIN